MMPCNQHNGCGSVTSTGTAGSVNTANTNADSKMPYTSNQRYTPLDDMPYYQMTEYMPKSNGVNATSATEAANAAKQENATITGESSTTYTGFLPGETVPPADTGGSSTSTATTASPSFRVPLNPLLPPGYQETLTYDNLQYMNGFLRTQIGKYLRVQQLVGSTVIEDRYGYLVGVGVNYILLQELSTNNILVLDFYNIKYVYIYYTNPDLPTNEIK